MAILVALAAALVLEKTSNLWFYDDEWNYILNRLPVTPGSYLHDVNGQLVAGGVVIFQVLYRIFGVTSYLPYRVVLVCVQGGFGFVCFIYLRRRVGNVGALLAVTLLLFLGQAWEDLLWPVQILFYIPFITTLGALLLLERRTRHADVGVAVCLAVGLATTFFGFPAACAVTVELALQRNYRRLWTSLVPLGLYGIWLIGYSRSGPHSNPSAQNIPMIPGYTLRIAATGIGALLGINTGINTYRGGFPSAMTAGQIAAPVLGILVLGAIAYLWLRRHIVSPRLIAVLVMPFAFWIVNAYTRAQLLAPGLSRYVLPSAFYIILVVSELLACFQPNRRLALVLTIALAALASHSLLWNYQRLNEGRSFLADRDAYVRSELGAVQLVTPYARASPYQVDPARSPYITAGAYLAAVDRLGRSGYSLRALESRAPQYQAAANAVVLQILKVHLSGLRAPTQGAKPAVRSRNAALRPDGSCILATTVSPGASVVLQGHVVTVDLTPQTNSGRSMVTIDLFGEGRASVSLGRIGDGAALALRAVPGLPPWTVSILLGGPLRICPA